jgi:hypothetical protein
MSITATASQYVLNALLARIEKKSVFTAHDVKLDAREKTNTDGSDEKIYHEDVRSIVHNEFLTGEFPDEYNRQEQLELANGQIAICYYPDGKVAEDHPSAMYPTGSQAAVVTTPAAAVSSTIAAPTGKQGGSVKDGNGFICSETSKGVINIPDAIVKAVYPNGGTYEIEIEGGITIDKAPDGSGRLRIASSKLGSGGKFRLEVVSNAITVTQV